MNLFALLSGGLGVEEHLRFDLGREGDRLTVLVQPILKAAPPDLADERQRLRGALAHSLWGSVLDVDMRLHNHLIMFNFIRYISTSGALPLQLHRRVQNFVRTPQALPGAQRMAAAFPDRADVAGTSPTLRE